MFRTVKVSALLVALSKVAETDAMFFKKFLKRNTTGNEVNPKTFKIENKPICFNSEDSNCIDTMILSGVSVDKSKTCVNMVKMYDSAEFPVKNDLMKEKNFGDEKPLPNYTSEWIKKNSDGRVIIEESVLQQRLCNAFGLIHNLDEVKANNESLRKLGEECPVKEHEQNESTDLDVKNELLIMQSKVNKTSADKLRQRMLYLSLTDPMEEDTSENNSMSDEEKKRNIKNVFENLHLNDLNILPPVKKSKAVGFTSISLYNNERRIRVHIFNNEIPREYPHNHIGHSVSLILSGGLTNQFVDFKPVECPDLYDMCMSNEIKTLESNIFRLYKAQREKGSERQTFNRNTEQQCIQAKVTSSHLYNRGNKYILPEDAYHRVSSIPSTVTLFSQLVNTEKESGKVQSDTTFGLDELRKSFDKNEKDLAAINTSEERESTIETLYRFTDQSNNL